MKNYFGKIDNLSHFTHPDYKQKFSYMNSQQSLEMAKDIAERFSNSNFKYIIAIESGTAPLIEMIKKINPELNILQIKIPRSLNFNLLSWFKTYLSCKEFSKREVQLKFLCHKIDLKKAISEKDFSVYDSIIDNFEYDQNILEPFQNLLKGTGLSKIFNSEFLVFDEYINAGSIIKNFNLLSRLFCPHPRFKLSAFCIFINKPEEISKIAFTLYSKDSELYCYQNGAYPFENRIDLIGYYYFINQNNFEKVKLSDLAQEFRGNPTPTDFYQTLSDEVKSQDLIKKLKSFCHEEQVISYIKEADLARYIIKHLEEQIFGSSKYSDFLDQVFELYAPAWSPMPIIFHLDYLQAFEKLEIDISKLKKQFIKCRSSIFQDILSKLQPGDIS